MLRITELHFPLLNLSVGFSQLMTSLKQSSNSKVGIAVTGVAVKQITLRWKRESKIFPWTLCLPPSQIWSRSLFKERLILATSTGKTGKNTKTLALPLFSAICPTLVEKTSCRRVPKRHEFMNIFKNWKMLTKLTISWQNQECSDVFLLVNVKMFRQSGNSVPLLAKFIFSIDKIRFSLLPSPTKKKTVASICYWTWVVLDQAW